MNRFNELLSNLIGITDDVKAFSFVIENKSELTHFYREYKNKPVANSIYDDKINELKNSERGIVIIAMLEDALSEANKNAVLEDKVKEIENEKSELEKKYSIKFKASRSERLYACSLYMALDKLGLLDTIGILMHQSFKSAEFIEHVVNGSEMPAESAFRRESDMVVRNKITGETYILLYDSSIYHEKEKDELGCKVLIPYGHVHRIREEGCEDINNELCTSYTVEPLKIYLPGEKGNNDYEKITKNVNSVLNQMTFLSPKLKDFKFKESEIADIIKNLDSRYLELRCLNPKHEYSEEEFNHIEKTAKLVVKGDYYNPHEMLEAVVKLNLTSDVKDGLIIHDDSDNKFWTVFFKKEASLKQKVKKLNNK